MTYSFDDDVIADDEYTQSLRHLQHEAIVKVKHHKSEEQQIKLDLYFKDGSKAWFKPLR